MIERVIEIETVALAIRDGALAVLPTTPSTVSCAPPSPGAGVDLYRLKGRRRSSRRRFSRASTCCSSCIPELRGSSEAIARRSCRGPSRSSCRIPPDASAGSAEARPATIGVRVPASPGRPRRSSSASEPSSQRARTSPEAPTHDASTRFPQRFAPGCRCGRRRRAAGDAIDGHRRHRARARDPPGRSGRPGRALAPHRCTHTMLTSPRRGAYLGGIASKVDAPHSPVAVLFSPGRRCGDGAGGGRCGPVAITGPVSAIGGTSATLNGTVNPGGAATDWWFEYGTSTSYGSKTRRRRPARARRTSRSRRR